MSFPPASRHGSLEQLFPDLFVVTGTLESEPRKITITRNMVVVRRGTELTLINSVRLSEDGERELAELGEVTHLVRLGAFHGLDDPYYVDRYRPTFWAPAGLTHKGGIEPDRELGEAALPLPDAQLFSFEHTARPEAALLLAEGGGTLVTCDAVTNVIDTEGCRGVDRIYTREHGFLRPASIGQIWRNAMTREHGPSLLFDYRRLLELDFRNLVSAHGPPLLDTASADLRETLRYLYRAELPST